MIEFYLSSDGKHTVHLSVDTTEELTRLSPVARSLYEGIVASYGNKPEMWQKVIAGKPGNQPATDTSASRSGGRAGGSTSADLSGTRSTDALTARSERVVLVMRCP